MRRPCNEYHKWKNYVFWFRTDCKICLSKILAIRYKSKRDEIALKNKEYYWKNKEKINAHKREYYKNNNRQWKYRENLTKELWFNWQTFHEHTREYIRKKWIRPHKCSICGNKSVVEVHHPSYDSFEDWSMVVFCCRSCHRQVHSWRIQSPEPINILDFN